MIPISVEGFSLGTDSRVIETTKELPNQFPFNLDYNSGDTIGFGRRVPLLNIPSMPHTMRPLGWVQSTVCRTPVSSTVDG